MLEKGAGFRAVFAPETDPQKLVQRLKDELDAMLGRGDLKIPESCCMGHVQLDIGFYPRPVEL